jgi:hypothetical protein
VTDWLEGASSKPSATSENDTLSEMSDDELEQIRRRLEGLL